MEFCSSFYERWDALLFSLNQAWTNNCLITHRTWQSPWIKKLCNFSHALSWNPTLRQPLGKTGVASWSMRGHVEENQRLPGNCLLWLPDKERHIDFQPSRLATACVRSSENGTETPRNVINVEVTNHCHCKLLLIGVYFYTVKTQKSI